MKKVRLSQELNAELDKCVCQLAFMGNFSKTEIVRRCLAQFNRLRLIDKCDVITRNKDVATKQGIVCSFDVDAGTLAPSQIAAVIKWALSQRKPTPPDWVEVCEKRKIAKDMEIEI